MSFLWWAVKGDCMTRVLTGPGLACTRDWVSSLRLSGKCWGHKGRYTLGDKLQQQVAVTDHSMCTGLATSCSNMLRRYIAATNCFVCTGEILWKSLSLQQNYVAATSHTNSVWFDFLQHVAATKFSSTHEAIYHRDVSSRHVAATCHLLCTDLNLDPVYFSIAVVLGFSFEF